METITLYVENQDGIYSAYSDKNDPYANVLLLKEATIEKELGEHLCKATSTYNEAQDVLFHLWND